ncbi:MAG: helix-turn-helix transcriptional regulator [Bacteroidota bacterium]
MNERLRFLRRNRNLHQQDIANLLGITRAAYSKLEGGQIQPSPDKLKMLSAYYQVSIDWIVTGEEFDSEGRNTTPEMIEHPSSKQIHQDNSNLSKKVEVLEEEINFLKKVVGKLIDEEKK